MKLTRLAETRSTLARLLPLLVLAAACMAAPTAAYAAANPPADAARAREVAPRPFAALQAAATHPAMAQAHRDVVLPPPGFKGNHDLAQLLQQRRSVREFAPTPLSLAQLGQLLWAAQGITADGKLRTAPSSGALYPLELYVAVGQVRGLAAGVYHYDPHAHSLRLVATGDVRRALAAAAVRQTWIATAPVVVVFGAIHARTAAKYGARAARYVHIEAGHAAQNLFLQAGDLGLGTADVGAFDDRGIARILQWPADVAPLLLMPVGVPR